MKLGQQFLKKGVQKAFSKYFNSREKSLKTQAVYNHPLSPAQRDSRFAGVRALESTPTTWATIADPNQPSITWNDESAGVAYKDARDRRRKTGVERNFPVIDRGESYEGTATPEFLRRAISRSGLPDSALEPLSETLVIDSGSSVNPHNTRHAFHRSYGARLGSGANVRNRGYSRFSPRVRSEGTVIHEIAHSAETTAKAGVGIQGDRNKTENENTGIPSAAGEGYADGIALRFTSRRPPANEEEHLVGRKYTPDHFETDDQKALFVAARTHAWTTGGLTQGANIAEAVHGAGSNPSVRQAIRAHGMTDTAKNLSEQFMATRKQGTQLSLLGSEHEYDVHDVDSVDWDN